MVDLISVSEDKEPYVKRLTDDKVINLTGQSGSGKSTYAKNYLNGEEFVVIDTDILMRAEKVDELYSKIRAYLKQKYPDKDIDLSENFDEIYEAILECLKDLDKTIVIDCAQFHCIKDIALLRGTVIVMRTSIDNCYNRCIERYKKNHPDCSEIELEKYKERKKKIYDWVQGSNEFLKRIDALEVEKEDR